MTQTNRSQGITKLTIGEWLSENAHYRIPMYQRRYAWGASEVEQLLHDLLNCPQDKPYGLLEKPQSPKIGTRKINDLRGRFRQKRGFSRRPYYIGSLVVFKNKAENGEPISYEVIDGQQRLTTLLLIAAYFKLEGASANRLKFENRPKSQSTLEALFTANASAVFDDAESAAALRGNFDVIKHFFEREGYKDKGQHLADFLCKKVVIMRIEVPPHTDVAHYFEIMNNRGEQLEMHEIVKARLLSALQDDAPARACLNQVWEACANMNQYVHFGFASEKRTQLFGDRYQDFLPVDEAALIDLLGDGQSTTQKGDKLREIIAQSHATGSQKDKATDDKPDRFQSIVNFPNFLLLALVLATHAGQGKISESTLDDKKLLTSFNTLLLEGEDGTSKLDNIKKFTLTLLRCRFLLDQFVIKRALDDEDVLTLKRLTRSNDKAAQIKAFPEANDDRLHINRQIQMLQAAFHVSHPRQAYKYWLLGTLHWLNKQVAAGKQIQGAEFLNYLESLAAAFMRDRHLVPKDERIPYTEIIFSHAGQAQSPLSQDIASRLTYPNIDNIFVFNYLDYLLWQENRQQASSDPKISHFEFKMRGAIEHYFPQKRADEWGNTPEGERKIDAFGNLSLIAHAKNTRLSDHSPSEKKRLSGHPEKVPDSIKQHLMMNELKNNNEADWNPITMKAHEDTMIQLLRNKLSAQTASTAQAQEKN